MPKAVVVIAALAAVAIFATVPSRVAQASVDIDRSRVWYGFFGWEDDGVGGRFRWTGRHATFHMREDARVIDVTMTGGRPEGVGDPAVDINVNGRLAERIVLTGLGNHTVRLTAPAEPAPYWRIDLRVSSTWVPADHIEGNTDTRQLGVVVREPVVVARRSDGIAAAP